MSKDNFFTRLWKRIEKTIFTFLSGSGVTWLIITWLIYKGKLTVSFAEYAIFTCGILALKIFKPKNGGMQSLIPPAGGSNGQG